MASGPVLATFEAPNIHGRIVDLSRRTIRAALTALEGDRDAAAREYGAILPELAELGLVFERAQIVLDMALLLGPDAPSSRSPWTRRARSSRASARDRRRATRGADGPAGAGWIRRCARENHGRGDRIWRPSSRDRRIQMSRLLVHIATGPENPTRVALGLLVARSALDAGHDVDVFIAGDGVAVLRPETLDLGNGIGTGCSGSTLMPSLPARRDLFASGLSSKARGLTPDALGGLQVTMAPPNRLVELAFAADRVITY